MKPSALPVVFASCILVWMIGAASGHEHEETDGRTIEQLGQVSFENSCAPAAQMQFERGVALLHSFWWQEGRAAFLKVLEQDPNCAIATWGIASIDLGNPFAAGPSPAELQEAQAAIARGRAIGARTERERLFVDAIAAYYDRYAARTHAARMRSLADAFESLAAAYPADDETQVFFALYLAATQDPSDKAFARTLRAARILEDQFARHPDHPGVAHYLIHSYDYPPIAAQGLPAARRYAAIAPSAPHALHMPSHIFTRVGAWQDSIDANTRAVATARRVHDVDQQLHAMDYMVYGDLQMARDADARRVIEAIDQAGTPTSGRAGPFAIAAMPARYAVERSAWREAAQLASIDTRIPYAGAMRVYARALGAARSGDAASAAKDVQELARLMAALKDAKDAYWATEVEVQRLAAAAWTDYAAGDRDAALRIMREAADLEDTSEKNVVTPGRLLPARELLGDMLLDSDRPVEALAEYEASQVRDPWRFRTLYGAGLAAARAGQRDKARSFYARIVDMAGAGAQRPELEAARAYLAAN